MTVTKQNDANPPWLLLVFSLSRKGASLRVTVWRKQQRYGALALGNSGYFLPKTAENRERFEWLATAIRTEGGEAAAKSGVRKPVGADHTSPAAFPGHRLHRLLRQSAS